MVRFRIGILDDILPFRLLRVTSLCRTEASVDECSHPRPSPATDTDTTHTSRPSHRTADEAREEVGAPGEAATSEGEGEH